MALTSPFGSHNAFFCQLPRRWLPLQRQPDKLRNGDATFSSARHTLGLIRFAPSTPLCLPTRFLHPLCPLTFIYPSIPSPRVPSYLGAKILLNASGSRAEMGRVDYFWECASGPRDHPVGTFTLQHVKSCNFSLAVSPYVYRSGIISTSARHTFVRRLIFSESRPEVSHFVDHSKLTNRVLKEIRYLEGWTDPAKGFRPMSMVPCTDNLSRL